MTFQVKQTLILFDGTFVMQLLNTIMRCLWLCSGLIYFQWVALIQTAIILEYLNDKQSHRVHIVNLLLLYKTV